MSSPTSGVNKSSAASATEQAFHDEMPWPIVDIAKNGRRHGRRGSLRQSAFIMLKKISWDSTSFGSSL